MTPPASVIVRARDEAATIERALTGLRRQTVEPEIIVVDSGSRDATRDIARRFCDRLIDLEPSRFSYGRALNIGAQAATAPFHFALSAHCVPPDERWIERALRHYERADVAGVAGDVALPGGRPLQVPFDQDAAHARAHPFWGFSNHGSSWRANVWERFPFDEDLDYAEDKEWALRVLDAGHVLVFDPQLWVDMSHTWRDGARPFYVRARRAARAIAGFHDLAPYRLVDLGRDWWSDLAGDRHPARERLRPKRLAGLAGRYVGLRQARRDAA